MRSDWNYRKIGRINTSSEVKGGGGGGEGISLVVEVFLQCVGS